MIHDELILYVKHFTWVLFVKALISIKFGLEMTDVVCGGCSGGTQCTLRVQRKTPSLADVEITEKVQ